MTIRYYLISYCFYPYGTSSFVLRPFPQLFWICMSAISAFFLIIQRNLLYSYSSYLVSCMILCICAISHSDYLNSIEKIGFYFVYYIVAINLGNKCKYDQIWKYIYGFVLVHLAITSIQLILPSIYQGVFMPFLPSQIHSEIIDQMNWNHSYYGFTVQTSLNAMYLSIGCIISALRACEYKSIRDRIIYIILSGSFLVCVFFTTRRGSSIVLLIILALIFLRYNRNHIIKILFLMLIIALVCVAGIQYIPGLSGLVDKTANLATGSTVWNGRDELFSKAISAILDHPLFGYGSKGLTSVFGRNVLENSFLSIIIQWGIMGFFVFFTPYIIVFRNIQKKDIGTQIPYTKYLILLFFFMSFVEDYFGAPVSVFLLVLSIFSLNNTCDIEKQRVSETRSHDESSLQTVRYKYLRK